MDIELLKKWNSWWVLGRVDERKTGFARSEILDEILKLTPSKEIVAITGVRRSGKSTILYQVINALLSKGVGAKNIFYFNFDEPLSSKDTAILEEVYRAYLELNNPVGRQYLFFDEIQNIREWEKWVKTKYELAGAGVKFFVTGSNNSMLSDKLATLLTGRMLVKTVFPLSFKEFLAFKKIVVKDADLQKDELKHYLLKYLEQGGFPEAVLEENADVNRQRLKDYFTSILFRDIVATREIKESAKLLDLTQYAATNLGTAFSYNKIGNSIGLNINTLKEYLAYLEQAYLVFQVNHFSYSVKESIAIQKPKKIYFIDNGMRNTVAMRFSKDTGRLAENTVFLELKRRGLQTYFYKEEREVDFVVKEDNGTLTAINVTYDDAIPERETKSLLEFKEKHKNSGLLMITKNQDEKTQEIKYTPLWKWLLS